MRRRAWSLNEGWTFTGKEGRKEEVTLPHTWNNVDGQDGGNDYYRGECSYEKELNVIPDREDCVFLVFDGVSYCAKVYLNGQLLAVHEDGFSRFCVELTGHLTGKDHLKVLVSNAESDHIYPQSADFTFYGGIYRDVKLLLVPRRHFSLAYGADGFFVRAKTKIDENGQASAEVELTAFANGEGEVTFTVAGKKVMAPLQSGKATAVMHLSSVRLWDGVRDPYLYEASASLPSGDVVRTRFGCRTFAIDPQRGFFLNGRSYPLRGVSRHQDRKGKGNALSLADHVQDFALIREMGANAVRLSHYQQAKEVYDLCDALGLVVWTEIPYISLHLPKGQDNLRLQLRELILQNVNHPCIVFWGLSNEITSQSRNCEAEILKSHAALRKLCHALDPDRPCGMAHDFHLSMTDPLVTAADVSCYNLYYGWYTGRQEDTECFLDALHARYPALPIGLTEYGADGNPALHSGHPERGDYSEEYQCRYHEHMLEVVEERSWLICSFVWNMFDFGTDGRDEGGKHGENQKGMVTFDRRIRKDVFYLYKAHWSSDPFVHLCGRRYDQRAGSDTRIVVYSNQPVVSLYVNDTLAGIREGSCRFEFCIPLMGTMKIVARAGSCTDEMTIRQVEREPASYQIGEEQKYVHNWD